MKLWTKKRKVHRVKEEGLDVIYYNINTLKTLEKEDKLQDLLNTQRPEIMCVAEPWFRADSHCDTLHHEGYSVIRNEWSGEGRKGGGLLFLTKEKLRATPYLPEVIPEFGDCQIECMWSLITGGTVKVVIFFTYLAATLAVNCQEYNRTMYEMLTMETRNMKGDGCIVILLMTLMPIWVKG